MKISAVNRLIILPIGVESSNHIGHLSVFANKELCSCLEALRSPLNSSKFPISNIKAENESRKFDVTFRTF